MEKVEELKQLSEELNLEFEAQDWGIINSDPERVVEFIDFYVSKSEIYPDCKYELIELVIASYNDALVENSATDALDVKFVDFLRLIKNEIYSQSIVSYWMKLDSEEFPVSRILCIQFK